MSVRHDIIDKTKSNFKKKGHTYVNKYIKQVLPGCYGSQYSKVGQKTNIMRSIILTVTNTGKYS